MLRFASTAARRSSRAAAWLLAVTLITPSVFAAAGGWADVGATTTGGAGGPTVTVRTLTELNAAIVDDLPRIVQVDGTINLGTSNVRFGSNKTIVGVGTNSGFVGNLKCVSENNVIIQNLNFTNPNTVGDGDGISIETSTHIWVDHCSFVDCGDGSLDIKRGADLITVSWCKFSYTRNSGHNFVNLIGHDDANGAQDRGKLRITFHHNWWSTLCVERMPRVRFGKIHSYNNYFNAPGNNYCIRASIESEVLAENNYFENIDSPYEYYAPNGKIRALNNITVNCTGVLAFSDAVFSPPYNYQADAADNVKAAVMAGAGVDGSGGGGGGGGGGEVAPAAPSGLTATGAKRAVTIAWTDNSTNESSFKIERSTDGVNFTQITTVGANVTSYKNGSLTTGTTYYYRVRASNTAGDSAYSNVASAAAK
jgi:pectate lyase